MGKYLWLAVTIDKYELPIAVTDTAEELGKIFGIKKNSVVDAVIKQRSGKINGAKFLKIPNDTDL